MPPLGKRGAGFSRTFTWLVHTWRVAITFFQFGFRPTGFPFTWVEVEMYEEKGSVGPSHRRLSRSVYDIDPGCSMRVTLPSAAPSLGPEISRMPSMTRLSRNGDAALRWRGRIFPDPFWPKKTQKGYGAGARACVSCLAVWRSPP